MKTMNLAAGEVLARAKERGYSPQEIKPCVIRVLPGDRWIVDVESPHYPHPRAGGPIATSAPHKTSVSPHKARQVLGVGGWAKKILSLFGIKALEACSCNKRALQMDAWGIVGCAANHRQIVQWFGEEASRRRLPYFSTAGYAVLGAALSCAVIQQLVLGTKK